MRSGTFQIENLSPLEAASFRSLDGSSILKRSSSPSPSLFKIWQIFRDYEKNNREKLEQSEQSIRKEIFWTFSRKKIFEKMALFDGFWLCWDIAKTQLKIWFLCLMFSISVPFVCTYGVRLHVDLTLLSMEMVFHTQILKKFRV